MLKYTVRRNDSVKLILEFRIEKTSNNLRQIFLVRKTLATKIRFGLKFEFFESFRSFQGRNKLYLASPRKLCKNGAQEISNFLDWLTVINLRFKWSTLAGVHLSKRFIQTAFINCTNSWLEFRSKTIIRKRIQSNQCVSDFFSHMEK